MVWNDHEEMTTVSHERSRLSVINAPSDAGAIKRSTKCMTLPSDSPAAAS